MDSHNLEFAPYNKISRHYLATLPEFEEEPIVSETQKAVDTLNSLCNLMEHRYNLLKVARVKNIGEYNNAFVSHRLLPTNGHEYMPYIVVVIDEYGDFIEIAGDEFEQPLVKLAQLARFVGIHLIISTRKITRNIVTSDILSNFQARIAFRLTSQSDSRMIIGEAGAEKLLGHGDMLFHNVGEPARIEGAFIDTSETEAVCDYISAQPGPKEPLELPSEVSNSGLDASEDTLDPFFDDAAHAIVISQQGSTSMIQRHFSIGYNRAGRLMDQLEKAGVVGQAQGSKPREVLIHDENSLNILLNSLHGNTNVNTGQSSDNEVKTTPSHIDSNSNTANVGKSGCAISLLAMILLSIGFLLS